MLSGVQIICFAASYAVAFGLELSRLLTSVSGKPGFRLAESPVLAWPAAVLRSGARRAVMLGFAAGGLVAHTAFLYYRAVQTPRSPLSSERDWYLIAAWMLAAAYVYLAVYYPRQSFGLFLLPPVLGLIAAGTFLARGEPFAREPASRVWGIIHGSALLMATVAVTAGFVAGLMYLGQSWRLKRKLPPRPGLRLPSLERLARTNRQALVAAVIALLVGIASGMVLNALRATEDVGRLPWHDPVILSTLLMLLWLLSAVAITARWQAARQGRAVAYLTVVSFVFLAIALGVMLLADTGHGGGTADTPVSAADPEDRR